MEKRRFSRVGLAEKSIVEYNGRSFEADLEDISLKGALLRFPEEASCKLDDKLDISFLLGGSDIPMRFSAAVVHVRNDMVGVKFVETSLETMIHLRGLMEARTLDPDRIKNELAFLVDDDK
jgi:hypothetical protein